MTRVPGTQEYSSKARLNFPFIFKGYPVLFWWCLLWCWFLGCVGLVHRRSGGHGWGDGASWAGYDFHTYPHPARKIPMPRDVMVEVVNSLGLKLLAIHNENNENNIAISPYGALSILVALGEGLQGEAVKELQKSVHLPNDIALIRIGLRDIHRHLQSYFIPKEGFLAGLTLNHENVTLRHDYEELLKFYGFDSMSFNNALYPEPLTTEKPIDITTTENPGREMTMEITSEAVSDSGISTLKTTSSLFESITTEPSITSTETVVTTTTNDITTVPSTTAKETATTIEPTVFTTKDTITTEATMSSTIAKEGTTTEGTISTTIAKEGTTTEPTAPTTTAKESTTTEATVSTTIAKEDTTTEPTAPTTTAKESTTTTEATISTTIAKEGTTTELTAPSTTAKESTIVEPTLPTINGKESSTESTETTATTNEITTAQSAITTTTIKESTSTTTEENTTTTTEESGTITTTKESTSTTIEESTSTTTEESTSKTTEESTIITTVTTTSDDISMTPSIQERTIIELVSTMTQSIPSTTIFTTSSTEITSEEDSSTKIDSFTTEMTTIKEDTTSTISYDNPTSITTQQIEEESTQNDDSIQDIEKSRETTSTAPTTTTESSPSETDTRTITDEVTVVEAKEEITTEQTTEETTLKQTIEEIITEQTTEEITSNQQTTQEFTTEQNPKEEITKNTTEEEYDEDKKSTEVVDVKGETETTTLLDFPYPDATKPVDTDITTPKTNENEINNDGMVITKRKRSSRSNYIELNKEKLYKEIRKPRSVLDYVIAGHHHDNPLYNQDYIENYRLVPHVPQTQPSFLVQGKYEEYQVNYMKYDTVLPFFYVSYYNALALSFPLDSEKYYLLLLLPTDANGIDKLICDLRLNGSLKYIIDGLRYRHVVAVIPSFMLKGYINLTPSLQKLGIRRVFEPGQADFSPMTDLKQIYITNIEQAITVNIRNYVDADSLSNTWQYKEDEPVEFTADHPFLYFVMDAELDVTLMSGKIVNPLNSRIT